MPVVRRFWVAAAALLAVGTAAQAGPVAGKAAGPAYQADSVVNFFLAQKLGASRAICVGTEAECGDAAKPQKSANFDLLVNFDFDSDHLTAPARQNLDQFAAALHDPRLADLHFEVDGHTDASGSESYNAGLSERRAKAVAAYLAQQGLDPAKLTPKGFGKRQPRVADAFDPVNRRVEAHVVAAQ